jgi:hypothetical protein
MLLERGVVQQVGAPHEIARAYNELNFGRLVHDQPSGEQRYGDHAMAEILDCWFEDTAGERVTSLAQGERVAVCMDVRFHAAIEEPIFAVSVRNEPRHTVFATSTRWTGQPTGAFAAGEEARVRIAFDNWLAPSRYDATPSVARAGTGDDALDLREDLASLVVHGTRVTGGIADVPHEIAVTRR